MAPGKRARATEVARRINAGATLLAQGLDVASAARRLARAQGVSERQARRYVEQARAGGRVRVPGAKVVFTVKLSAAAAERVRRYAQHTGSTISSVVEEALEAFLKRRRARRGGGGGAAGGA